MSRESQEQDAFRQYEDNFPKGAGDPDAYGYPGEPVEVHVTPKPLGELIMDIRPF